MGLTLQLLVILAGLLPAAATSVDPTAVEVKYPRNVILVIGDGMGLAHIGLMMHTSKAPLVIEQFPIVGLQKTSSYTHLITDSGAAATAMACGEKTYNSAIGMAKDTTPCANLIELAHLAGKKTGIVVTSSLVHATPAAFVAHQKFRGFREAIAIDYLSSNVDYAVGGGLMYFTNRFTDDRNLWRELEAKGYLVSDFDHMSFKHFLRLAPEKVIYFTAHMEPDKRQDGRVYFTKAVTHGLEVLKKNGDDGFFMMVEGSQIDYAGHENNRNYLLAEMRDFDEMLAGVIAFAEEDGETLVIVTADNSTGGLAIDGGKPGKGSIKSSFTTTRHTADMVPVYAYGPGAELFSGIYDNTEIFHKIRTLGRY
jgi:alkaline phosphatase